MMSNDSSKIRVLSIDGGGIRGILPAQILAGLEKIIREKIQNSRREELGDELAKKEAKKARVTDYFDMIAGTSTGGLLACLMMSPHHQEDAQHAVTIYEDQANEIFEKSWYPFGCSYKKDGIERFLKGQFNDLRLNELKTPCLITAYEFKRRHPFFFRQHRAHQDTYNFLVRDVARATSAAPTFFPPARIQSGTRITYPLVDGGVFANNPAMCALIETLTNKWTDSKGEKQTVGLSNVVMLSLGTGRERDSFKYEDVRNYNKLTWVRPLIQFMMDGNADTIHYQLDHLFEKPRDKNNPEVRQQYFRINPTLEDACPQLDDTTPKNLRALTEAGRYAIEKSRKELETLADLLIETHDSPSQIVRTRSAPTL
jgi:uncharacterized protein